jgi:hypothetical protein
MALSELLIDLADEGERVGRDGADPHELFDTGKQLELGAGKDGIGVPKRVVSIDEDRRIARRGNHRRCSVLCRPLG